MKIALKLAYLGDAYYGFQRQPDVVTVDSEVRKALLKIGVINGDFCYAGRTDRGVSALGQVIDFWIDEDKAYLARPRCVNGRLPRDIWTWAWAVAPIGFSARWNAQWREYRYLLWHPGLDLQIMRECAERLKGEHDFRNFSSAKVGTVKTVQKLEISEQSGLFVFDIRADGFLWNMVRKIVGALEKVGSGQKDESDPADAHRKDCQGSFAEHMVIGPDQQNERFSEVQRRPDHDKGERIRTRHCEQSQGREGQ